MSSQDTTKSDTQKALQALGEAVSLIARTALIRDASKGESVRSVIIRHGHRSCSVEANYISHHMAPPFWRIITYQWGDEISGDAPRTWWLDVRGEAVDVAAEIVGIVIEKSDRLMGSIC